MKQLNTISEFDTKDEAIEAIAELADLDINVVEAYDNLFGLDESEDISDIADTIQECYWGEFEDDEDFAYEYLQTTGQVDPDSTLGRYFDYEKFARDLMYDFSEDGGYYFINN